MLKVIIKGYYGFGNLGDDLLMVTAYNLTKSIFPAADIRICSESSNPEYIFQLLQEKAPIVRSNQPFKVDWIIHGGGGVFFDFKQGNKKVLNDFIKLLGYRRYKELYFLIQKIRKRGRLQSKYRTGWGIGVGTYTASSNRYYIDILDLCDFNFLLVRDKQSELNIKNQKFSYPVQVASDLVFLSKYWNSRSQKINQKNDCIGFILRDWEYDSHSHVIKLIKIAGVLKSRGYSVKFFSFDERMDQFYINNCEKEFSLSIWRPGNVNLSDYLEDLALCNIVITSRAHGAIIGACLGIPALIYDLEPKLRNVSDMLRTSSSLIELSMTDSEIVSLVEGKIRLLHQLYNAVQQDVVHNHNLIKTGIDNFELFVKKFAD